MSLCGRSSLELLCLTVSQGLELPVNHDNAFPTQHDESLAVEGSLHI